MKKVAVELKIRRKIRLPHYLQFSKGSVFFPWHTKKEKLEVTALSFSTQFPNENILKGNICFLYPTSLLEARLQWGLLPHQRSDQ